MNKPTVLRFEATDVEADLFQEAAILTMETTRDGRVAVQMPHAVFALLFERMRLALQQKA